MSLLVDIKKRIELLLTGIRPNIPDAGTNHIDDPGDWTVDSIYKGELAINADTGELFTSDGIQPINLSTIDGILEGLEISTSGASLREINISAGTFRINGRVYKHDGTLDVDDATITVPENIEIYPRLDAVAVKGDMTFESGGFYGAEFKVFKGNIASDIPVPSVDDGYLFLGFVLVMPNQTVSDVLRPLPVTTLYGYNIPLNINPLKFEKDLTTRILQWETDTLYLENQVVEHDNNLYQAAYTHVSDGTSLSTDFAADKLVSMGAVTASNISRFSHIGSTPTSGNFVDHFFDHWNTDTRILDAFQDISAFINSFAPTKPVNIDNANLQLVTEHNKAGFTEAAYAVDDNYSNNIVRDNTTVEAEVEEKFTPYDSGALKSYLFTPLTSYSTDNLNLDPPPSTLPNTVIITDAETKLDFTVVRDDHYGTQQGYKGFYNSIDANLVTVETLTPSEDSYKLNITHLSSADATEVEFYVESVRTPSIANVENFIAVSNDTDLKYLSGVPVLKEGDHIEFDYEIHDAVRYFYNHEKITEVSSDIMEEALVIDFGDTGYFDPGSLPPLTLPAGPTEDGPVIETANVACLIAEDAISSSPSFVIKAYNALADSVTHNTGGTGFLVDDVTVEEGVRLTSGVGDFPAGSPGVDWGVLYDEAQTQVNILGNKELQLFGGKYFYPQVDYTAFTGVTHDGSPVAYPDYSNSDTDYRWTTFNLGTLEAKKHFNLEIRDTTGILYDLTDGVTVTPDFKMYIMIYNPLNPAYGTGWLDLNKAYNSTLIENPTGDGDPALDLGWMEGNANYRRASFGTIERTGIIYVRIGTSSKSISFKDVVETDATPELNDAGWDEYNLGEIVGESYVILSINGTDNSLLDDFLNGTTMTSNFDMQVRVLNTDNASLGTDWIDANEAYPANAFIPEEYQDPALDLTYYDDGETNPDIRKITFGPTTRTGQLQVRLKINGDQHYDDVTVISPSYLA
jgi:hypothetical protein